MDDFFLRHDVIKDRDIDEMGDTVNSDSEASDEEPVLPASAADPSGPWMQERFERQGKRRVFKKSSHTGPKGVITDYKAYKQAKAEERKQNEAMRNAIMTRIAKGCVEISHTECNNLVDNTLSDSDEFSDDEMMKEYCAKRMLEIKTRLNDTLPVFGTIQHVDTYSFVDLVDAADQRVNVIAHICDERNQVCIAINKCLKELCGICPHTQFLVVNNIEDDTTFQVKDLPIVLVYQGGQQIESFVNVLRELQGIVTLERIKMLLAEYI
ncbi:hypothetical protein THRCLA_04982 [Thraustotheca clavata]|uniref:Phosducin domain-containing protein n=1 Tax=Thraustotheca clavata TaxID=74557 RepID=A0A1V9ZXY9_9STRA|nr:hypothetical protein THRCLA_04982 [Thraustotheca clavata]